MSPVSPPPSPGQLSPGGASVISTRSGRLSTAHCHLWCCKALSTGSGASRRRPAAAAASGSSLPAALARSAPTAGVRPCGASPARPTRSAGSGHCGRHSGPPSSCARASPSLSEANCFEYCIVDDANGLQNLMQGDMPCTLHLKQTNRLANCTLSR